MNTITYNGKTYTDQKTVTTNPLVITGDDLVSASAAVSDAIVSDKLEADTMTATVIDNGAQTQLLAAGGVLVAAGGQLLHAFGIFQHIGGHRPEAVRAKVVEGRVFPGDILCLWINVHAGGLCRPQQQSGER